MSTTIKIHNLTGDIPCEVVATLRPGLVIVAFEGALVFAAVQSSETAPGVFAVRWEFWAGSPNAEEKAALDAAIEAHGGFDKTTVVITPPETPTS